MGILNEILRLYFDFLDFGVLSFTDKEFRQDVISDFPFDIKHLCPYFLIQDIKSVVQPCSVFVSAFHLLSFVVPIILINPDVSRALDIFSIHKITKIDASFPFHVRGIKKDEVPLWNP